MGSGSACTERKVTSRSCPSSRANPTGLRHVVGRQRVGGLVESVAGRVYGRSIHREDEGCLAARPPGSRSLGGERLWVDAHIALGRSRGGLTTKLQLVTDGHGLGRRAQRGPSARERARHARSRRCERPGCYEKLAIHYLALVQISMITFGSATSNVPVTQSLGQTHGSHRLE
jgi:hypothetical protein